jgi:hypothetical protein
MTSSKRFGCFASLSLLLVFWATPVSAQRSAADIESARQLYQQGIARRNAGDLPGALEKLKAAHALGNTPITGVELCKVHIRLNQPVEAREVCLGVARIPPLRGETTRSDEARRDAALLAAEQANAIAFVGLVVTGTPTDRELVLRIDGAPIPAAALREERAMNPGHHEVSASVGDTEADHTSFDVTAGEHKKVTLSIVAQEVAKAPTPPPVTTTPQIAMPPKRTSNALSLTGWVVGGVGIGVGAVAGLVAMSSKSSLDQACIDRACGTESHAALDHARTWGNVSTAGFIVGGAGVLVAGLAMLFAPSSSPRAVAVAVSWVPVLGLRNAGLHASF